MSLSRESIYIEWFNNDFIINIGPSYSRSMDYSSISSEIKRRLKSLFSGRLIKKSWQIGEEMSPISNHKDSPSIFIPYLLLAIDCANKLGFEINQSQIRYMAEDDKYSFICGVFAVEKAGKSVSRIETYPNQGSPG